MIYAPVTEVKVYRNSAVVRRRAVVRLHEGTNETILSGLGGTADPDSLRLFFPAGVVGKDVQIVPFAEAVGRLPSEEVNDEIVEIQNRIETLKTMEKLWVSNGNFQTRGECSAETVEGYLEALPAHLEELRAQRKELDRQVGELTEKKARLEKKEAFRVIRLILESAEDREVDCEIEYSDRSAGWGSTYEIHTTADRDEICVISRARIAQNTGEDWENVHVSLYTGNPAARQEIPHLRKLSLQFRPEVVEKMAAVRYSNAMMGAAGAMPMMTGMAMNAAPMQQMAMQEAEETDDDTMTGYSLPGTRTIVAGTVGTMADLKTVAIPAEKRIVCVPKLDDSAYLAAVVKTADWPLKPSNAKIYLNENYCGEIYVAPDMTEETFMLSLGKDERVSLNHETVRSKTEDVMLKGQKRKISEFAIRIGNRTEKPLTLLVSDQIPVSSEKQIAVDRVSADGASIDEETGKVVWDLTVAGKASVEKRLSYTVTYPKDKTLQEVWSEVKNGMKRCRCGAYASGKFCPNCGSVL